MKSKTLVTGMLLSSCAAVLGCSASGTDETVINNLTLQDFLTPEGPDLGELSQQIVRPHLTPYAQCVLDNGNGTFTARWGYTSSYAATENLPVDNNNRFLFLDPLGIGVRTNGGQPTRYVVGDHPAAFETTFEFASVWWVDGSLAWATQFTQACSPDPAPTCSAGTPTAITIDLQSGARGSFHSVPTLPFVSNSPWKHASNHQVRWTGSCADLGGDDGLVCTTPTGTLEANRQYQTWDLSSLSTNQEIIAANMVIPHASNSYIDPGNGDTETVVFYSVDTDAGTLASPDPGECACADSPNTTTALPPIFDDLGTGEVYGRVTVDASVNTQAGSDGPDIPINTIGLAALNSARGGLWNVAGAQVSGGEAVIFGEVERVWRGGGPLARLELTVCQ